MHNQSEHQEHMIDNNSTNIFATPRLLESLRSVRVQTIKERQLCHHCNRWLATNMRREALPAKSMVTR